MSLFVLIFYLFLIYKNVPINYPICNFQKYIKREQESKIIKRNFDLNYTVSAITG